MGISEIVTAPDASRAIPEEHPMSSTTVTSTLTGTCTTDPRHSRIGFVARHTMVTKVRGSFNEFEGSAYVDAENPSASKVAVTVKTASSDTRNSDRDAHLRSNDFIDMDTYPEISFLSTDVEAIDEGYRVTGDLTIKGVTKPVAVDFEYTGTAVDPYGNTRVGRHPGPARPGRRYLPPDTDNLTENSCPSIPSSCTSRTWRKRVSTSTGLPRMGRYRPCT
jgi:polyisoprenoid-binding protein YceI